VSPELALTLLEARVLLVDDVHPSFTTNNFVVGATLFHRCLNLHDATFPISLSSFILLVPINDPPLG